jgi:hypothetical protein
MPWSGSSPSLTFEYAYEGMEHSETWQFLELSKGLGVLYYCGTSNTWEYEGGLVITRFAAIHA